MNPSLWDTFHRGAREAIMPVDSQRVKPFWESRAKRYGELPLESITNLEDNEELLKLKLRLERERIFSSIALTKHMKVLDLGAGTGIWSAQFAQQVGQVYAVEYLTSLIDIGRQQLQEKGIKNVTFIHSLAQTFRSDITFDFIFISGLLLYLSDDECAELCANIPAYSRDGTILLLRDSTGLQGRFEINDKYSPALKTYYSAMYRTREEYIEMFRNIGFSLLSDGDMFPGDCELNKYPETRLRMYLFKR